MSTCTTLDVFVSVLHFTNSNFALLKTSFMSQKKVFKRKENFSENIQLVACKIFYVLALFILFDMIFL